LSEDRDFNACCTLTSPILQCPTMRWTSPLDHLVALGYLTRWKFWKSELSVVIKGIGILRVKRKRLFAGELSNWLACSVCAV
jgi:hypothetical protein